MSYKNRNTWLAKIKRTFTAFLPIAKNRQGECNGCGDCCKLPNVCHFLRSKLDNISHCAIYPLRPLNCRKYPRTDSEFITPQNCGYKFCKITARK